MVSSTQPPKKVAHFLQGLVVAAKSFCELFGPAAHGTPSAHQHSSGTGRAEPDPRGAVPVPPAGLAPEPRGGFFFACFFLFFCVFFLLSFFLAVGSGRDGTGSALKVGFKLWVVHFPKGKKSWAGFDLGDRTLDQKMGLIFQKEQ